MGKSHVLGRLADTVRADSGAVVWVAPDRQGDPYQLMVDLLDALGEEFDPDGYPNDRALSRAVRAAIGRQAAATPTLLALDGMHAADQASLRVLRHFTIRQPPPGLLVAVAYRSRQAPAALISALSASAVPLRRLELGPVATSAAAGILGAGGTDPDGTVTAAHRFCGGNPLYLKALAGHHRLDPAELDRGGVLSPESCVELTKDLAELPATTQLVARGLAVGEDGRDMALLARICELDEGRVLLEVDELVAADVIRTTDDGFAFRHPLVRQAVLDTYCVAGRVAAHRRALDLLRERGSPPVCYVRHLEPLAVAPDDVAAREFATAGEAMRHQRPALAARWFARAAELLGEDRRRAAELHLARADADLRAGRLLDAYATTHDVLRALPGDPDATRLGALAGRLLGRRGEAAVLLLDNRSHDDVRRAELVVDLAITEPGTKADVAAAVRGLGAAGRRAAQVAGHAALAQQALTRGAGNPADHLNEAARLADRLPDSEFVDRLDLLVWLSEVELSLEQHDRARRHSFRAATIARATGQVVGLGLAFTAHGAALGWLGRLTEAADVLDQATAALAGPGCEYLTGRALAHRAWVAARGGDPHAATRLAQRSLDLLGQDPDSTRVALRLAEWRLAAGIDPDADARRFLRLAGGPELLVVAPEVRAELADGLVSAGLALGWAGHAQAWAERLVEQVAGTGLAGRHGLALRALAKALLGNGNPVDAAQRARAATELLDRVDATHEAALAGSIATAALAAVAGDDAEDKATKLGISGLTNRETQIAELVSTGMTNAHIARSLRISEKTVEGHLTRMFDKLAIPSRAALASLLTRAQMVP